MNKRPSPQTTKEQKRSRRERRRRLRELDEQEDFAAANALWQYNDMLAHDGLGPVKDFPPGTQSEKADTEQR